MKVAYGDLSGPGHVAATARKPPSHELQRELSFYAGGSGVVLQCVQSAFSSIQSNKDGLWAPTRCQVLGAGATETRPTLLLPPGSSQTRGDRGESSFAAQSEKCHVGGNSQGAKAAKRRQTPLSLGAGREGCLEEVILTQQSL